MVEVYYNQQPEVVIDGWNRHGEWVMFVAGGVRDLTESEAAEHEGVACVGYSERAVIQDYTAEALVSALSDEMVLALNQKECEALIGHFDDEEAGWKALRTRQVMAWDSSAHVNSFVFHGVEMWLSQSVRNGLIARFNAEKTMGHSETTVWYGTLSYTLNIDVAYQLVYALEVYASECYDVTAAHVAEVAGMDLEGLKGFDYKIGYPEQLRVS